MIATWFSSGYKQDVSWFFLVKGETIFERNSPENGIIEKKLKDFAEIL
jgi:hypothetical protein